MSGVPAILTLPALLVLATLLVLVCGAQRPTITATTATQTSFRPHPKSQVLLYSKYGEDVTLYCSSDSSDNLRIRGDNLQHKQLNSTTVQAFIKKPNLGEYEYTCTANGADTYDSLMMSVDPAMSVKSPGVRCTLNAYRTLECFVPQGEDYAVECSGNEAEALRIRELFAEELKTDVVNGSTIRYTTRADAAEKKYYQCIAEDYVTKITVTVDYRPEARHFQCNSYHENKFECTWDSSSKNNKFKLFYVNRLEGTILLCINTSREMTRTCAWSDLGWRNTLNNSSYLPLLLQSCNQIFCGDETFSITYASITRLRSPSNLRLLNTSAGYAVIAWQGPDSSFRLTYKVEFRLLTMKWRRANVTARCLGRSCEWRLALPCPRAPYELRVYVKPEDATDRFWSHPASIYFTTETGDGVMCGADLVEPELITSQEKASSEIGKLVRYAIKEELVLNKKRNDMKQKRVRVGTLRDLITKSSAKGSTA